MNRRYIDIVDLNLFFPGPLPRRIKEHITHTYAEYLVPTISRGPAMSMTLTSWSEGYRPVFSRKPVALMLHDSKISDLRSSALDEYPTDRQQQTETSGLRRIDTSTTQWPGRAKRGVQCATKEICRKPQSYLWANIPDALCRHYCQERISIPQRCRNFSHKKVFVHPSAACTSMRFHSLEFLRNLFLLQCR